MLGERQRFEHVDRGVNVTVDDLPFFLGQGPPGEREIVNLIVRKQRLDLPVGEMHALS